MLKLGLLEKNSYKKGKEVMVMGVANIGSCGKGKAWKKGKKLKKEVKRTKSGYVEKKSHEPTAR